MYNNSFNPSSIGLKYKYIDQWEVISYIFSSYPLDTFLQYPCNMQKILPAEGVVNPIRV